MLDLYNNKYDRETLKKNIYAVKLIDILKTQIIDVSFAVRYLLNYSFLRCCLFIKKSIKKYFYSSKYQEQ